MVHLVKGGGKVGPHAYTYSKTAISSCPGASQVCTDICYAEDIRVRWPAAAKAWEVNYQAGAEVPSLSKLKPGSLVRIHVSGDFDTAQYIHNWREEIERRPDLDVWVYTRSWRVTRLLPALEKLRSLHNVQLWASMDDSMDDTPPKGWRRAYIQGDSRVRRGDSIVCPSTLAIQAKLPKITCEDCKYCLTPIKGKRRHVVFPIT